MSHEFSIPSDALARMRMLTKTLVRSQERANTARSQPHGKASSAHDVSDKKSDAGDETAHEPAWKH